MEKKRVVPIWLSVILTVLCVAGVACNIYDIIRIVAADYAGSILTDVLVCLLYISGLTYCFMGYKKKAAAFFKTFCVLAVLVTMSFLYLNVSNASDIVTNKVAFMSSLLTFGAWCIVAFVSDLGRKQSLIAAWTVLATTIISSFFIGSAFHFIKMLFQVVVCVIFLIMVYAKYQDKAARGTK